MNVRPGNFLNKDYQRYLVEKINGEFVTVRNVETEAVSTEPISNFTKIHKRLKQRRIKMTPARAELIHFIQYWTQTNFNGVDLGDLNTYIHTYKKAAFQAKDAHIKELKKIG